MLLSSLEKTTKFFSPYVYNRDNGLRMVVVHIISLMEITIKVGAPFISRSYLEDDDQKDSQIIGFTILSCAVILPQLLNQLKEVVMVPIVSNVQRKLTDRIFEKNFQLPYSTQINTPAGEFAQAITVNYGHVTFIVPKLYGALLPFITEASAMLLVLAIKTGLPAIVIPVTLAVYGTMFHYAEKYYSKTRDDGLTVGFQTYTEMLSALARYKSIKQFDLIQLEKINIKPLMSQSESTHSKENTTKEGASLAGAAIGFIGFALSVMYAIYQYNEDNLDPLDALVVNFLLFNFAMSLQRLTPSLFELSMGIVAAKRVVDLDEKISSIEDKPNATHLNLDKAPPIAFHNVMFSYPETNRQLLNGLSFSIMPGEVVAFIGATGIGKSTIAQLLQRFYAPTSGEILINDQDISDLTARSLRYNIAIVEQNSDFIAGTWFDNIKYAKPDATENEIESAAEQAGLNTSNLRINKIGGPDGRQLSGGEKQRFAIARALLKGGQILVLDEATSALDPQTEHEVQQTLNDLIGGPTTIIITHKLYTLPFVSKIFYLENGQIAEEGTCAELISKRGLFYSQISTQLQSQGHQITPEAWLEQNQQPQNRSRARAKPAFLSHWKSFEEYDCTASASGFAATNPMIPGVV